MKKTPYLLVILFLVVSCTHQMQLITLKPSTKLLTDDNFEFRDSLVHISYNFYSPNGKLTFRIHNASTRPIYIDWKNSMYIASVDNRQSYWTDESTFNGSSRSTEIEWISGLSTSSGSVKGKWSKPDRITFLPPDTEITVSKYQVSNVKKLTMPVNSEIITDKINWKKSDEPAIIKRGVFDIDNSPIKFRNYITVSLSEDLKEPIHYDFGFWAAEVLEMEGKQMVGDFLYLTNMDSTSMKSKYHPYKQSNRFFIPEK